MFVTERRSNILDIINSTGRVKVKELSEQFEVTEDCIRKDLSALESDGLLKKTYGGAVSVRAYMHAYDVAQRKDKDIKVKIKIAEKALDLISKNDLIFLDISTSNIELAKLIVKNDLSITVVTNMIEIMNLFNSGGKTELIFIGGRPTKGKDGFVGQLTQEFLTHFRFDCAFMGAVGVDLEDNVITSYMPEDSQTKRCVLSLSKKSYLMLETTKFNQDGTYQYAGVDELTGVIMDTNPGEQICELLQGYNIEIIY